MSPAESRSYSVVVSMEEEAGTDVSMLPTDFRTQIFVYQPSIVMLESWPSISNHKSIVTCYLK